MKKIFYSGMMFLLLIPAVSCKKALNTVPTDFIATQYFYNTEAQLDNALTAIYELLGRGPTYRNDGVSLFNAFNCTDEMYMINTAVSDNPANYSYSSSLAGINNLWVAMYEGIQRANLLLANIDKATVSSEAARNNIKGQAKFLRAYYYFLLVSNFGDVPLKTLPTASVLDVNYTRTPAAQVYDFIIKEMTECDDLVYPITNYTYNGRVTKSAVEGILARVCLYKAGAPNNDVSKYAEAQKWADKVVASGLHSLNPDYSQVFINMIQDKYDIKESIWEAEFETTGAADGNPKSGGWGNALGIRQLNTALGYSTGATQVHIRQYNRYENNDLRRDWAIAPYHWLNDMATANTKVLWLPSEISNRYPGKFRREYELQAQRITNYNSTNGPILRYSDVLLMAAEAENELNGPTQKAKDLINLVRERAYGNGRGLKTINLVNGGAGYTSVPAITISGTGSNAIAGLLPAAATATIAGGKVTAITVVDRGTFFNAAPTVTISGGGGAGATATATLTSNVDAGLLPAQYASKDVLRTTIQEERARELCFEGTRRNDLIRWGILISTMKDLANEINLIGTTAYKSAALAGSNISEKYIYFPLPLRELTLNPLLKQNPGF
jgi:hypothetical protein